ncbi:FAD-binding and (Fe-S)-binding domain-containing protein [Cryobacterium psychrophilum]|uniref:FAD-binding oxidoreductase n=1 Tax=Cryobacterium psychrophilum TaxID=41988 RepID=A0A4Y8KX38_9MICO|nr:FAD-binding and (Fe-S)-binding domain-containing protein [Cryobacterium psychrophilum]TDW29438.1 FAD/FMN-containing dehydrogenase [Cryobacterium psychrophilum]TFD81422.1 FAD-binding oxidoreductase [Cryobacterium psychrophilum]
MSIDPTVNIDAVVRELSAAVRGIVDSSTRRRAEYSADASNYRVVPQVVVMPRDEADVLAAVTVARRHLLAVTVRGGGTSCAGNAVGPGMILDFSRFMNKIVSIDAANRTAIVQPGVVLSDLQKAAAVHGLRFGPDPSTSTRCTVGGMIGNNACGPHGLAYGRTADNVVRLRWLTGTGTALELSAGSGSVAAIPGLEAFIQANLELLRTELGRFGRQISGYSLEHLLPENGRNLVAALTGTEGTCGVILEAEVNLVVLAPAPVLVILGYADMPSAADAVPALLPHRPLALEGIDAQLVKVVRSVRGSTSMPSLPNGNGWLMVEVGGDTAELAVSAAHALVADAGALDSLVLPAGPDARRLWQIRADGAGLAGRTASGNQAWPGWEDAAVPPQHLGAYLRDFQSLMQGEGLSGLAYGHFGDGCVHVRIDFPLEYSADTMKRFLTAAAHLVASYGGSLSGEHGDGRARGELLPIMYSPRAIAAFAGFKTLLDPQNLFNPGVIVDPDPIDASLRRPQALNLLATDGFAFTHDSGNITNALHRCVGVGKCRADLREQGGFMCPSYLASADEKDSTRGRARVLQEMLNGGVVDTSWSSPEVHDALDLCLSCKACANDCPTGIDMAMYKSEALFQTYRGRIRPISHYTLGRLPTWLRLVGSLGPLLNVVGSVAILRRSLLWLASADPRRSLPTFARVPFRMMQKPVPVPATGTHRVLLWVDSFTDSMTPEVAVAAVQVLTSAGCDVQVAGPGACCGLTLITTGQLTAARATLQKTVAILAPHVDSGRTIIGLEPSCTAVLRSDLLELLPGDLAAQRVSASVKTVAEFLGSIAWKPPASTELILAQPHCHQHAVMGYDADLKIMNAMGCDVQISGGCCGLAGNFGMEKGHYDISVAIARQGILGKIEAEPARHILADGFSCRTQVSDLAGRDSRHLVQVIADALQEGQ